MAHPVFLMNFTILEKEFSMADNKNEENRGKKKQLSILKANLSVCRSCRNERFWQCNDTEAA